MKFARELLELQGQAGVIPGTSALSELIVCEQVGAGLRLSQMVETDDRDFLRPEPSGLIAPVTCDGLLAGLVDQNGRVKAECVDASRDRPHLDPANACADCEDRRGGRRSERTSVLRTPLARLDFRSSVRGPARSLSRSCRLNPTAPSVSAADAAAARKAFD